MLYQNIIKKLISGGLKFSEYLIKQYKMLYKMILCHVIYLEYNLFDKFFDHGNNHVLPALIHI